MWPWVRHMGTAHTVVGITLMHMATILTVIILGGLELQALAFPPHNQGKPHTLHTAGAEIRRNLLPKQGRHRESCTRSTDESANELGISSSVWREHRGN